MWNYLMLFESEFHININYFIFDLIIFPLQNWWEIMYL